MWGKDPEIEMVVRLQGIRPCSGSEGDAQALKSH